MLIYVNESDFTKEDNYAHLTHVTSDVRKGIQVAIHSHDTYPIFSIRDSKTIALQVGVQTEISLKPVMRIRKEAPYPSNCSKDGNPLYKKLFTGKYTHDHCVASCFYLKAYDECGYVAEYFRLWMPDHLFPVTKSQTPIEQERCLGHLAEVFKPKTHCDCPLLCKEFKYKPIISRRPWPQNWQIQEYAMYFAKALNVSPSMITKAFVHDNFLLMNIFFDSFNYEEIVEEPLFDLTSLVSGAGGCLGLFLGASIISLIELVWLVSAILLKSFKRKSSDNYKTGEGTIDKNNS